MLPICESSAGASLSMKRKLWGWYDRMNEPWRFITAIGMLTAVILFDTKIMHWGPIGYFTFGIFVLVTRAGR